MAADTNPPLKPNTQADTFKCPACGRVSRTGTLVCPNCGEIFEVGSETLVLDGSGNLVNSKSWPKGEALVAGRKAIVFEIDKTRLALPVAEVLSVGRASQNSDCHPDVDLNAFDAQRKGVSRHHITITRKELMLYVSDAGSSNGTWLNGHRLIPHAQRVLRNGDELQLSHLRIKVHFE
jgi:FHA domain